MSVMLVLPESLANEIAELAAEHIETAGVLLATVAGSKATSRLLAREFHPVPNSAYKRRTAYEMEITSDGYVRALSRAETLGAIAIWFHTHPGPNAIPLASTYDAIVDLQLNETFRARTGSPYYGALIVSPGHKPGSIQFSGYLQAEGQEQTPITRLWSVGDRFRLMHSYGTPIKAAYEDQFDRNVRAFGGAIQEALGELKIGIVGCGGTGSAVVEQLARLGVNNFVLLDPDELSLSNTTRVYGSCPADVGKEKIQVAEKNIQHINPKAHVSAMKASVMNVDALDLLSNCDVLFGCTDDNAGRMALSRFSTYLLCPLIDCGIKISSDAHGKISGIDGRVTVQTPGVGCLVCRSRIDMKRAGAEMLSPGERKKLEDEGYAPALGQIEPAVVTFTTTVASAAISELLERLIGYGPEPRPSEVLLRFHDRDVSTNSISPQSHHYCDSTTGKWGQGLQEPYLGLVWAN
jgi:proteasome lid subunit RPN8/RPN11